MLVVRIEEFKRRAMVNNVPEDIAVAVAEIMEAVRRETIEEVRANIEKAAKGHDDLAARYPNGSDKIKAAALRCFAEVFL